MISESNCVTFPQSDPRPFEQGCGEGALPQNTQSLWEQLNRAEVVHEVSTHVQLCDLLTEQMPENDACMSMPMMTDGESNCVSFSLSNSPLVTSDPQSFEASQVEQTPANALASMPLISDGESTCVTFQVSASDAATNAEADELPLGKCPNFPSKKWASSVTTQSENLFVQIVDAGKISRGVDHTDSYQIGDLTRGLCAKIFGK